MRIHRFWSRRTLCHYLLKPLALLFQWCVFCRRLCFQIGLRKAVHLSVPVIVVGNITTGGTGKTPLIIWLANRLRFHGYQPGIISRGYRGRSKQWPCPVFSDSDPYKVGDEPVLLARRTSCPVVVGPSRVKAAQYLLAHYQCDVLLSDDGLQHYALARDIEVLMVDGLRRFGNGWCLPAGPLREPLSRLNEVDFVVCHGEASTEWISMYLVPDKIRSVMHPLRTRLWSSCRGNSWQAVAGIGHPERFFSQLVDLGFTVHRHIYRDHHRFSRDDIVFDDGTEVIMTEKDAVKCFSFADERHWYLPVSAELPAFFEQALLSRLKAL